MHFCYCSKLLFSILIPKSFFFLSKINVLQTANPHTREAGIIEYFAFLLLLIDFLSEVLISLLVTSLGTPIQSNEIQNNSSPTYLTFTTTSLN